MLDVKRRHAALLIPAALTLLLMAAGREGGPAQTAEEKLRREIGEVPLPPGAIKLTKEFSFPSAQDESKGLYLSKPAGMAFAPSGLIYVSDHMDNKIHVFDLTGHHVRSFGQTGQGPGDFQNPREIACSDSKIFIVDRTRIQMFDPDGEYVGGFTAPADYLSMTAAKGHIYGAPLLFDRFGTVGKTDLIDMLDYGGSLLLSFGTLLKGIANRPYVTNAVTLALGPGDELWVSFKYFPIVRRYGLAGQLLQEFHYNYGIAAKKEAINRKILSETSSYPQQVFEKDIVATTFATTDGLYFIDFSAHRFLLALMKNDGRIAEYFWAPLDLTGFFCGGMFVVGTQNSRKFYILNQSDACVDVYTLRH